MTIVVILLGAFLINYLLDACFRSLWAKKLTVRVQFQDQPAMEGEEARLTETIANEKRLFLPLLQVGFRVHRDLWFADGENTSVSDQCYKRDIFSVGGYQKITRTISFRCTHRGYYEMDKVELVTRSPLMTRKYYKTLENRDFFYVYPRLVDSDQMDISFQKIMGSSLARRNLYEDPFEFRGIREYAPTDPLNKINWKAAARTGELMVNLYGSTTAQEVILMLDVEDETIWKYDEIHEEEIRIAASLASRCIQEGIPVGFCTNGKDILSGDLFSLKAGTGEQQVRLVNEGLSRIDLTQKADPMEFVLDRERVMGTGAATTYVMISKNQRPSCVEAFCRLAREGSGCIWIATLYAEMEWKLPHSEQISWIRWEVEK